MIFVIVEDTDLLCHYAERVTNDFNFKPSKKGRKC